MQRETHVVFGVFLFMLLWSIFKIEFALSVFVGFGAIFPDIDFQEPLRKYHRKLLHNIWIFIAASIIIGLLINIFFALAFMLGALSHLLADSLTPVGVYPFYPLRKEKKHLLKRPIISTGSERERIFQFILIIFIVLMFILPGFL